MNQKILNAVNRAFRLPQGYNEENKLAWRTAGRAFFKHVVADLGLPANVLSYNPAGIALSGDFSICAPGQGLYLCINADKGLGEHSYYRGCDPKDKYGTSMKYHNCWFTLPQDAEDYASFLDTLRAQMRRSLAMREGT